MKLKIITILLMYACFSCKESSSKQLYKPESSGNINTLLVVVDNHLWQGRVGDAIRFNIGNEVYGLPQVEPHFDLRQIPTDIFSDFVRRNRLVLKIDIQDKEDVKYYKNPYASPQLMIAISAPNKDRLIDLIEEEATKAITSLKAVEFKERQRRIDKSLFNTSEIENKFNIEIKFSSAYRVAKAEDHFCWIRRDTKTGSLNMLLYSLPLEDFQSTNEFSEYVLSKRDSITKQHIPGPTEGSFMQIETAYTPHFSKTNFSGTSALESRSLWKVDGAFMSGPFVNYCIIDKSNNRYFFADGFVYAPSERKRDFMFEIETMIRSISLK